MASAPVLSCGPGTVLVETDGLSPTCTRAVLSAAPETTAASVTRAWKETWPDAPGATLGMVHVSVEAPPSAEETSNSPAAGPRPSMVAVPST